MKNKKLILLFIVLAVLLFKIDVHAASTCTSDEKKALVTEAQNVIVEYELRKVTSDDMIDPRSYFYTVIISNISKNLYYKIGINTYTYNNANKNREIVLKDFFIGGGTTAKIFIYSADKSKCTDTLVRTVLLKMPYYNYYSEREECKGLSKYSICDVNSNTSNIEEKDFLAEIEKAKKMEEEKNSPPKEEEKEKSLIDKCISYIQENYMKICVVIVSVIIIILVIILILKRINKNKIKIDLKDRR